jgi:hypothetical protein
VFDNEQRVKKTSLNLNVERQLTGWCEQVTTWRDQRGLLYSHSDIVCILIQSICIEFRDFSITLQVFTDVSEELVTSIFRAQVTTYKTSRRHSL